MDENGIVINSTKTVALPSKAPTAEEFSLLRDARSADEGGVTVVGVPIGTNECTAERAMKVQ